MNQEKLKYRFPLKIPVEANPFSEYRKPKTPKEESND